MDFPRLGKLSLPAVPEPEDVVQCGSLEYYDKAYDRWELILEMFETGLDHRVPTTLPPPHILHVATAVTNTLNEWYGVAHGAVWLMVRRGSFGAAWLSW
jgi:hypothetical protein